MKQWAAKLGQPDCLCIQWVWSLLTKMELPIEPWKDFEHVPTTVISNCGWMTAEPSSRGFGANRGSKITLFSKAKPQVDCSCMSSELVSGQYVWILDSLKCSSTFYCQAKNQQSLLELLEFVCFASCSLTCDSVTKVPNTVNITKQKLGWQLISLCKNDLLVIHPQMLSNWV